MRDEHPDDDELQQLMAAYQAGEIDRFDRLYALLCPDLRRYLASAGHDGAAVDDLVQDTFIEIHRSRRTYLPALPVRPWVFGIARNVLRHHRRLKVRQLRAREVVAGMSLGPWQERAHSLGPAEIEEALRQVPRPRRRAWRLHHQFGFSFKEIAVSLGIAPNAAKLRASRATSMLRDLLGIRARGDRRKGRA
ncbi:MAG: RNA polymerase sigma factor [Vicinamibacterales bacterium]